MLGFGQFGYATLFAVAFPMAPLLAIVNNVIEIRSDSFKLVNVHRRFPVRHIEIGIIILY